MLPQKQRQAIWQTANKLYPTFMELLTKIQEMIQDDFDSRQHGAPMDVDNIDGDHPEEEWVPTG